MGHGVGLLAEVQQCTGDAAGHVQEGQVTDLAAGLAQALRELQSDAVEKILGVFFELDIEQTIEPLVADLRDLALGTGADDDAAYLLRDEEPHLADELALVDVGEQQLATLLGIVDHRRDGTFDEIIERVGRLALTDEFHVLVVALGVTVTQQGLQPTGILFGRRQNGHGSLCLICPGLWSGF